MHNHEPIIALQKFDSLIEANIIKAKLDAYGIPCFLTNENITSLTTAFLSGGIWLYIFEADKQRVVELLHHDMLHSAEEDDLLRCPKCHSKKILPNAADRFGLASVFKRVFRVSKGNYCVDCGHEFD